MKVDLTLRDVELILLLLNDFASSECSVANPPIYSLEELALIDKLEDALKKGENYDKELIENTADTIYH